jgi:prepilin-type N-terminal cleavage/methylation domain-containing protein
MYIFIPKQRKLRRAFTMLELMVSVSISTVLVMMMYGTFTMQTQQLRHQDMRMEMHQNGRFALEILTRSLRMAGFGSGAGFVYGALGNGGSGNSLPAIIPSDGGGSDTDAVTLVYMEPSLVMNSQSSTLEACSTSSITFNPNFLDYYDRLLQFKSGDLLMCQDYAAIGAPEAYLWAITDDASGTTPFGQISITASSESDYSTVCGSSENLSPVMRCSKGQVVTFYIDDEGDEKGPGSAKHPVLMMDLNDNYPSNDDIPLVDNIEDLQLQYCIDDGTDTTSCNVLNKWVNSFTASSDITNLWATRVSLVVRSPKDDWNELYPGRRPRVANHNAAVSTDYYFREIISSEVVVRNLRLLSTK